MVSDNYELSLVIKNDEITLPNNRYQSATKTKAINSKTNLQIKFKRNQTFCSNCKEFMVTLLEKDTSKNKLISYIKKALAEKTQQNLTAEQSTKGY